MKSGIILGLLLAVWSALYAQASLDTILSAVEKNNTDLITLRKHLDADRIGNKIGIYPEDPEVEFGFLQGDPSPIGNRTDISIRQTFDFPTVYVLQRKISDLKNRQLDLEYARQRRAILLHTRLVCADLLYSNAVKAELYKRLLHARQVAEAYEAKYKIGDANILDYNKARLNLLNCAKAVETVEIDRRDGLAVLAGLNGGIPIVFADSVFPKLSITPDFTSWYQSAEKNSPALQWLQQENAIQQKQVQISQAQSLPKFSAGYTSERVVGESYQGVSVGISLPLWKNKNTIRYARAKSLAASSAAENATMLFRNEIKAVHAKVIALQASIADYRQNLSALSNEGYLDKAFAGGELSLTEYIYELSLYYDSVDMILEMERNYFKAAAELLQYQ